MDDRAFFFSMLVLQGERSGIREIGCTSEALVLPKVKQTSPSQSLFQFSAPIGGIFPVRDDSICVPMAATKPGEGTYKTSVVGDSGAAVWTSSRKEL